MKIAIDTYGMMIHSRVFIVDRPCTPVEQRARALPLRPAARTARVATPGRGLVARARAVPPESCRALLRRRISLLPATSGAIRWRLGCPEGARDRSREHARRLRIR